MLDVTRLRVLVAVARHGSVTAAARALNYAQPSVSHHLARLEAETGARLIQRRGRGIRLTEAGLLLAGRAEEILGRLDAAEHELATHLGQCEERVRMAAFASALATIVPAAMTRLAADRPDVEVILVEAEPPVATAMLRSGQVDAALVFRHPRGGDPVSQHAGEWEGMRARLLFDEQVHLVSRAPPEGPVRPAGAADLAACAREQWIAGCEHCRRHLLWLCEHAGFTPKIVVTTDDHVAAQALVAAGVGVAILPELDLRAARHPGVQARPLPGARRQVLALAYGQPPDPPAVNRLLAALGTGEAPA